MLPRTKQFAHVPLACLAACCLLWASGSPAKADEYDSGLDPLPYRLPAEFDPALQTGYVEPSASDDRLAALEAEVKRLSSADAKRKADAAKKPTFQIGGQLQTDYLYFGQDAESREAFGDINDGVYFRRARLVAQGEAFEQVKYAIGFDFSLPGRPSFLGGLREAVRAFMCELRDPYRPELHYMRGPGPKSQAAAERASSAH